MCSYLLYSDSQSGTGSLQGSAYGNPLDHMHEYLGPSDKMWGAGEGRVMIICRDEMDECKTSGGWKPCAQA